MCPICSASFKDFSTIQLTEDFVSHLTLEHRTQRETDEPQAPVRGRRAPHLAGRSSNPSRTNRRNQMQLGSSTTGPVGSIAGALASGVAAASTAAPNGMVLLFAFLFFFQKVD